MEAKSLGRVINRSPSSLRDPAGFIFKLDNNLYRTVNHSYKKDFDLFLSSGLYDHLVSNDLLIEHTKETNHDLANQLDTYQVLKLKQLPFISYPTEWCFSQLKNAALFTLKLQTLALDYGMTLKDASAFNVQYQGVKPIFIDTLSFEEYKEGNPWLAYEQFCRHFIAPLSLMSYQDDRLQQLLRVYIDGIPLDLTAKLLPLKSYFNLSLFTNVILQAKAQKWFSHANLTTVPEIKIDSLKALINNLRDLVEGLKLKKRDTTWEHYYESSCIYSNAAMISKHNIVERFLNEAQPKMVWDLGSNDGKFSRIASTKNIYTLSMDFDPNSVEENYLNTCKTKDFFLLPLLVDIINPSPAQGWSSCETQSLIERGPADCMLALALIHHLVITNSLSLSTIAASFASMCNKLIIEFMPENDPQVEYLLQSKPDKLFTERYNIEIFEREFKQYFVLKESIKIEDSGRVIYYGEKK